MKLKLDKTKIKNIFTKKKKKVAWNKSKEFDRGNDWIGFF